MPVPKEGEVLVALQYASLNHLDLWTIRRNDESIIPGSDGAGLIVDTGGGAESSLIGQEVIINPGLGWGSNQYSASDSFDILGTSNRGTLAEYVSVPVKNIFEKPAHLSLKEAAVIPMAGVTAYRGLFEKGRITSNDTVLITGIGGGVALFMLQFALAAGARVYVTSSSDIKIEKAISLGATGGFNYTHPEWVQYAKKTAGGFDLILDGAAGEGFSDLTEVARSAARIILFGKTSGNINNLKPGILFNKQISITGTLMGSNDDFSAMIQHISKHDVYPVIDSEFSLTNISEALKRLTGKNHFGKISIRVR